MLYVFPLTGYVQIALTSPLTSMVNGRLKDLITHMHWFTRKESRRQGWYICSIKNK